MIKVTLSSVESTERLSISSTSIFTESNMHVGRNGKIKKFCAKTHVAAE